MERAMARKLADFKSRLSHLPWAFPAHLPVYRSVSLYPKWDQHFLILPALGCGEKNQVTLWECLWEDGINMGKAVSSFIYGTCFIRHTSAEYHYVVQIRNMVNSMMCSVLHLESWPLPSWQCHLMWHQ